MWTISRAVLHSQHGSFALINSGRVGLLQFTRPSARNSISSQMCTVISESIALVSAAKSEVRVLVITGDSTSFSAGKDLKASLAHTPLEAAEYYAATLGMVRSLVNVPIPVIIAMEKVCLGLGLEIALTGDIRVAGSTTQIGFPEVNLGLFPGCDGGILLPSLFGNVALASDLILTGRRLSAPEAFSAGIVSRVVPEGTSLSESLAIAEKMSDRSRELLMSAKKVIRFNFHKEMTSDWLALSAHERQITGKSPEHIAALRKFSQKSS